jgi:hypothetical protein
MLLTMRDYQRRGMTASTVAALLVAGILLLALGYVLGRRSVPPSHAPVNGTGTQPVNQQTPSDAGDSQMTDEPVPYRLEPPTVDFGFVKPSQELSQTIAIHNISDQPITVEKQVIDCKCTTAQNLEGRTIQPGSFIELTATIDPQAHPGPRMNKISLLFHEHPQPAIIEMFSEVSRAIRVTPARIHGARRVNRATGEPLPETEAEREARLGGDLTLTAVDDRPFRILAVNGDPNYPIIDFDPAKDEPQTEYRIPWSLREYDPETCVNAEGQPMPRWYVVETDHPDAPVVDITVQHTCTLLDLEVIKQRGWYLSDERVVLGGLKPNEPAEFEVTMAWLGHAGPRDTIRMVESESDQFDATLISANRIGNEISCRIRIVPNPAHRGLLYGSVRLHAYTPGDTASLMVIGRVVE